MLNHCTASRVLSVVHATESNRTGSEVEAGQRGEWWRLARPRRDCFEPIQPRSRFFDGYVTVGINMFGSSTSTSMTGAGRHWKCEAGWVGRVGIARAQRRRLLCLTMQMVGLPTMLVI
jgi:hypothetical protein